MVPELVAAYGFSWRKTAPRPHLSPPTGEISNFLADGRREVESSSEILLNLIIEQLSSSFSLPAEALLSRSRQQRTAFVRRLAMYLGRRLTRQSYAVIGRHFGRHHTTVLEVCRIIEQRPRRSRTFRELIEQIEAGWPGARERPEAAGVEVKTGRAGAAEKREAIEQRAG